MAQCLRALAALPENLNLTPPHPHQAAEQHRKLQVQGSDALLWLPKTYAKLHIKINLYRKDTTEINFTGWLT